MGCDWERSPRDLEEFDAWLAMKEESRKIPLKNLTVGELESIKDLFKDHSGAHNSDKMEKVRRIIKKCS